ncbi:MAG: cadherin domain-containing protein, partial [Hyphomicrobium sp.]
NDTPITGTSLGVFAAGLPLEFNFPAGGVFNAEWRTYFGGYEIRFAGEATVVPGASQFTLDGFSLTLTGSLSLQTLVSSENGGIYAEAATATMPSFSYTANFLAGDGSQPIIDQNGNVTGYRLFVNADPFKDFMAGLDRVVVQGSDVANFYDATYHHPNTLMLGGGGDDYFLGSFGHVNEIFGGGGNDLIRGYGNGDTLDGGAGNDDIADYDGISIGFGGQFNSDTLLGGADDDQLNSYGGNDRLEGGDGNDVLSASIFAGSFPEAAGSDTLTGGAGNDTINGGAGDDITVFTGLRSQYAIAQGSPLGAATYTVIGPDGTDYVQNVERFQFDNGALTLAQLFNQGPTIASNGGGDMAAISIGENTLAVTSVAATDPDQPAETLTYSILSVANGGGADAAQFTIDAATGALAFIAPPNFEAPTDFGGNNVYDVTVEVTDGAGGSDTQDIQVAVSDVLDAPQILSIETLT